MRRLGLDSGTQLRRRLDVPSPAYDGGKQQSQRRSLLIDRMSGKNFQSEHMNSDQSDHIVDTYPLSPMQQGMLFHSLSEPNSGVDLEQVVFSCHGPLNAVAFRRAWGRVASRHAVLRTSFRWEKLAEPLQDVHREVTMPFAERDWTALSPAEQDAELTRYLATDRHAGFDLSRAPNFRVMVARLSGQLYRCVWTFHHILLDGRAFPLVLNEVFSFCSALGRGEELELPQPRPFRNYVDWLQQQDWSRSEAFWREKLKGFTVPTNLRTICPRKTSAGPAPAKGEQELRVSEQLTSMLKALAAEIGVTLNTLVQGAWALLLSRYSGEQDIVFGTTRACRRSTVDGADSMVGIFINTVPLRVGVQPGKPLAAWLKELRDQEFAVRQHEHTPLINIQKWSEIQGRKTLFDSFIMFDHASLNAMMQRPGGAGPFRDFELKENVSYPLLLQAYGEDRLALQIQYSRAIYDDATVSRMLGHLQALLEGIVEDPGCNLSKLPLLTHEEEKMVMREWNRTKIEYPKELCLHELFERQAARTPEVVALVFQNQQLTFRELDRRANFLARQLRAAGVGPNRLVGLYVERSLDLCIGVLGILKAGGAYVPMDPAFPAERLGFMVEDAKMPVIVTQASLIATLPPHKAKVLTFGAPVDHLADPEIPMRNPQSDDLAYVIFTSGSTGRPKGVQIPHRAVVNFLNSMRREPGLVPGDVLLAVTTLSFDIAGLELFLPLTTGATVVIAPREMLSDGNLLKRELERVGATVMQATPITWRLLLEADWKGNPRLKILVGGEAVPRELVNQLVPICGSLWNLYGPTETTIWSTTTRLTVGEGPVSIGRPIDNTQVYIVNPGMQLQPVGVPGELLIGGDGLAHGYLDRPELTAEKFVVNPFAAMDGSARLYRTGDLARWWPDGTIECLGRIDHQVKLRGFRIELGEIEAVLDSHPAVSKSAVIARDDAQGEKRLVAYYIVLEGKETNIAELRLFLKGKLPDYMVPSAFVRLPGFPMTPNRKIDRKALPEPDDKRPDLGREYVAPRTETGKVLCRIWAEVLGVGQVGIHDDFFDLGGHSLMVLRTISTINERLKSDLPPVALFEHPTIAGLCAFLETEGQKQAAVSAPGSPKSGTPPEASKVNLALVASIVAQRRDQPSRVALGRPYRMRESWICKWILAPLYRIDRAHFRPLIQYLILKMEGGELFTVTLRKLYVKHFKIQIGDYSEKCFDVNRMQRKTKIGRYTGIYPTVVIQTADHPRNTISTNALFYHPAFEFAEGYELPRMAVEIGNDVWIGHNATILYPTRKIGDGAVVATGSVVVEDVPPYAIVGGDPARILRYRFSKEIIEELLKSRWWEASLEELEPVKRQFTQPLEGDRIR